MHWEKTNGIHLFVLMQSEYKPADSEPCPSDPLRNLGGLQEREDSHKNYILVN